MNAQGANAQATPAPLPTTNAPGLPALSYRVGTRPAFLAAMVQGLSSAGHPALAGLRTRELSDPSMAMLDAWATAADVLTFYQERLCNEGYLRTATWERSVRELAALVGWRPRPGVAATAYLAYTLDPNTTEVLIPAGSRANSVPGPGETMQAFESSTDLPARAAWNQLRPRMSRAQDAAAVLARGLCLAGTATGLKPNDALVLDLGTGTVQAVRVKSATADAHAGLTRVELTDWTGGDLALAVHREAIAAAKAAMADVAGTATAQRIEVVLDKLAQQLGTVPAAVFARSVGTDALVVLGTELATARERGWTRLVPSLERARTALAAVAASPGTTDGMAPGSFSGVLPAAARLARKGQSPIDALVDGLLLPASVPPANSQKMERSFAATFTGAGNVYPQLLAGLYAKLAPTLYAALAATRISNSTTVSVSALRRRSPLFGHNAQVQGFFKGGEYHPPADSKELDLAGDESPFVAYLDGVVEGLQPGQHVVMERGFPLDPEDPAKTEPFGALLTMAKLVRTGSRKAYGLSGPATTLVLADGWWKPNNPDAMANLRASAAYVQEEALELAQEPITDNVQDAELELDGLYDGLTAGRWVIVTGERADLGTESVQGAELLMLAAVAHTGRSDDGTILAGEERHTFLTLAQPLAYSYKRDTVAVYGNVAHATHGETRKEVLGAGSAAAALQQFSLKAAPLTYLAAPTPAGAASTLVVRVNGVQWPEVPGLAYLADGQRGFFTATSDTGAVTVTFGSPPHGQRLPSGGDNVQAGYRSGIGAPGNVRPGQISQLATRPLGVTEVTNPLRTSGGADPEPRELIRANAPRSVTALDRLVSVQDYADFAATFAGIGKASSALLYAGGSAVLQVTIAGLGDVPIEPSSDLFRNLRSALTLFGETQLRLQLVQREALALVLSANVLVQADYDWTLVEPAVRAALLESFGFAAMALGEDLASSAVIATMAAVPGVAYVDLDVLKTLQREDLTSGLAWLRGGLPGGNVTPGVPARRGGALPRRIAVLPDRVDGGIALPAQLAYLQAAVPDSLILNEVQP